MAKRKTSTTKAARPAAATAAARPAAATAAARPRRRSGAMKGVAKIPKMTAAAGMIAANSDGIIWTVKNSFNNPRATLDYIKATAKAAIRPDNLAKTAKAGLIGYGIGYVAKKFAPKAIKKPMAKIANKVM